MRLEEKHELCSWRGGRAIFHSFQSLDSRSHGAQQHLSRSLGSVLVAMTWTHQLESHSNSGTSPLVVGKCMPRRRRLRWEKYIGRGTVRGIPHQEVLLVDLFPVSYSRAQVEVKSTIWIRSYCKILSACLPQQLAIIFLLFVGLRELSPSAKTIAVGNRKEDIFGHMPPIYG